MIPTLLSNLQFDYVHIKEQYFKNCPYWQPPYWMHSLYLINMVVKPHDVTAALVLCHAIFKSHKLIIMQFGKPFQ
jgi:hypothetical protein